MAEIGQFYLLYANLSKQVIYSQSEISYFLSAF